MTYERLRGRLLGAIAVCGLLMMALSFGRWVSFVSAIEGSGSVSVDLSARETSRFRDIDTLELDTVQEEDGWCSCRADFGDGYLTLIFGVVVVAATGMAFATWRDRAAAMVAAVASLAVTVLAGYNALADWQAVVWTEESFTEAVRGTVQLALWVLTLSSVAGVVLGVVTYVWAGELDEEDAEAREPHSDAVSSPAGLYGNEKGVAGGGLGGGHFVMSGSSTPRSRASQGGPPAVFESSGP